jgi:hypothetical protein
MGRHPKSGESFSFILHSSKRRSLGARDVLLCSATAVGLPFLPSVPSLRLTNLVTQPSFPLFSHLFLVALSLVICLRLPHRLSSSTITKLTFLPRLRRLVPPASTTILFLFLATFSSTPHLFRPRFPIPVRTLSKECVLPGCWFVGEMSGGRWPGEQMVGGEKGDGYKAKEGRRVVVLAVASRNVIQWLSLIVCSLSILAFYSNES